MKKVKINIGKQHLLLLVLAVLIVISSVQAIQLADLKESVSSGKISVGKGSFRAASGVATASASSGGSTPASLDNLPGMVGGC